MQTHEQKPVGAWRIILILLAVMIALPAFVMGAEIGFAFGARPGLAVCLMGGAVLGGLAALTGAAGAQRRCTTYELIGEAFGPQGAKLTNAVLGISVLGWYGVMATMLGHALAGMGPGLASQPLWLLSLAGCVLTTVTAMVGFRALNWLSTLTTPLKIGLLAWTFGAALSGGNKSAALWSYAPAAATPLGTGVSMVVGGLIVGAVLTPDVCRFAVSPKRAALGAGLAYGLGFPLVLILSGTPSLVSGEKDMIRIMLALGLGLPAMLTVVLTAWSTNTFNLYSATLIGQTLAPRVPSWRLALLAGVVGTAAGLGGISEMLLPYLLWLSITIPPIAGIYLVHVAMAGKDRAPATGWRPEAIAAWVIGSAWAALAPRWGWALTPVAAIDALGISAAAFAALSRLRSFRSGSSPGPVSASRSSRGSAGP
ncbi:cytosine permease [Pelomonas sp. KK5]|uniref:cytosine permease n=1 Tax=Pelomonas sp. KK5 TaxID=1855730 RepID=UPI00097C5E06|nr:cytosine permease [Pelomonas sp. KK5]